MYELEELLHSLAYEKALPIALSNFHTHFSGIFVMPWQLTAKIVFMLLKYSGVYFLLSGMKTLVDIMKKTVFLGKRFIFLENCMEMYYILW